jgi:hypothetical protein
MLADQSWRCLKVNREEVLVEDLHLGWFNFEFLTWTRLFFPSKFASFRSSPNFASSISSAASPQASSPAPRPSRSSEATMPGVVEIPPQPQVGRNAIRIELDGAELVETLRLLSLAVKEFENQAATPAPSQVCVGLRTD